MGEEFKPAKLPTPTPARSRSRRKLDNPRSRTRGESNDAPLSSSNPEMMASVVFTDYDYDSVFDEIDALNPHEHEGGDLVDVSTRSAPPGLNFSTASSVSHSFAASSVGHSLAASASTAHSLTASARSGFTSSPYGSSLSASMSQQHSHYVPTDYETLMNKTKDGSLADLLSEYDDDVDPISERRPPRSVKDELKLSNILEMQDSSLIDSSLRDSSTRYEDEEGTRESIVGGKPITEMTLEEQASLLQRSSRSLFTDEEYHEIKILSSVDWNSLNKSCKCAKNAFRDCDYSGPLVVTNMFLGNLAALIAQCNLYVINDVSESMERVGQLTSDTKRALRFGMSCLSPPRSEETSEVLGVEGTAAKVGSDFREDVERYKSVRNFRQELQDAAVKSESEEEHNRYGLHLPLVDVILGTRPNLPAGYFKLSAGTEKDQYTIQVLAARMLCNIVTDNPVSAEIVLMDVPFGPNNEETERRMSMPFSGDPLKNTDIVLCWSDLVAATAKLGSSIDPEREVLAAVAAALHNLLASLETRDSLIELENEMKRREQLKGKRARALRARQSSSFLNNSDDDSNSMKPIDAGFDAVYNRQLMNALLRNILSANAVIKEARSAASNGGGKAGRPKFQAPKTETDQTFGDTSDSASEWISLIIERMASRGLLPQMFQSAGGIRGISVTPEQVVLTSCIRQAVDDYHSEMGEFGRRRLSIAAKSAGVTTLSRPHPLWGRVNDESGLGGGPSEGVDKSNSSVVPNLLFLANQLERLYVRTKLLTSTPSEAAYDGELSCTLRVVDDIRDMIGQCLGRHKNQQRNKQPSNCTLQEARSIIGRETSIVTHCLFDLANLLDSALAKNTGKSARDLHLSPQEQHSAIVMVRLLANIVYQCRHNQDILRIIPIPPANEPKGNINRVGLHVILSTTSLAPTCLTLREWCIVAIRNAVEGNEENAEAVRLLEAQNTVGETPELRRMGMRVNMDGKGKVHVQRK